MENIEKLIKYDSLQLAEYLKNIDSEELIKNISQLNDIVLFDNMLIRIEEIFGIVYKSLLLEGLKYEKNKK